MRHDVGLDRLLARARSLESRGRIEEALGALVAVAGDLLDRGESYQYLFEWMARLQRALGEHAAADEAATVAYRIAEDAAYLPGMVRMDVLRAQIACDALDLSRAEALLAGLRGDGVPLGPPLADRRDQIASWLRSLRFVTYPRLDHASLRVETALAIAALWSERGKYESALHLVESIENDLGKAHAVRADQVRLLEAEWMLAAGQIASATARLRWIASHTKADRLRISVVRTRAALTGGNLAHAVSELDTLSTATVGDPQLFCAATLARLAVLVELNLSDTAQRTADEAIAQLTSAGAAPQLIAPLEGAKRDAAARARSALALWEIPFAGRGTAWLPSGLGADAADGSRRFGAQWAAVANRVFLALERQDLPAAAEEHARLEALTRDAESPMISCRVRMSAALVAYYSGGPVPVAAFREIARDLLALGARLPAAQALRFTAWASARAGSLDDYAAFARQASDLIDTIAAELGAEHRALFLMNKWSGRDELVSVRVRELLRSARGRPSTRRLRGAFREIDELTHWPVDDAFHEPHAATLAVDASPDLAMAWVRERLHGPRRAPRGAIALDSALSLWRFPARTLALHYHVLPDRTYLFRIARRHIDLVVLPVGRAHLAIDMHDAADDDDRLRWLATHTGIADALDRFPEIRHLIIVPHDAMANVPFAALPIGARPLCSIVPVTQVDRLSRLRFGGDRPRKRAWRMVCAGRADYHGSGLPDLPGADRELEAVAGALALAEPARRARTRSELLDALRDATHLHVAAHGVFDENDPACSGIVLGDGAGRFERLTLHELRRTNLHQLQLATLATCRSGQHARLPGRERICVPTALLDAGAHGVIASMWPVEDEPSVEIMAALYRELATRPPAAALAAIQAAVWKQRPARQWAGLVFYGSDR